ncbi:putative lysine decarboxylase [Symmachiella macrocystis]|uniref:AMP nucleosidase n=1 Tax=Symmachiella macrocystis TaxID=2527985 RepID=A0A5C6BPQ3_9PLAN|nr:TIGR00730 family Rossman fold protein [Symmachiella macrocystis]TWU12574.1 putative lysine decarboxylase [Symmachiella macrocystis]
MTKRRLKRADPNLSEANVLPTEHFGDQVENQELIDEIKETADKLARDKATRGDLKLLSRALRELRYAFKVFTPYRKHRKVTIFGSARTQAEHEEYKQAAEFGRLMAAEGWMALTGAGGGIMEAGHVGAGKEMSMGVNIMLPFEQDANYVINDDEKLVHLKYFFTRKLLFVKEVHAIALFPGGFGTQDEGFETLTLVQTGKRDMMPIVFIDEPGGIYWKAWLEFISEQLLARELISPADMSLFLVTDDVNEAVEEILSFYSVYNSMRYVRNKLVLRLHCEPSDAFVERLNDEFSDIVEKGRIEKSDVLKWEMDEEHLLHLPRLVFQFDRHGIGRLREMIDVINSELGEEK